MKKEKEEEEEEEEEEKKEPVKGHMRGITTTVSCFSYPIKREEVSPAHYNTRRKTTITEEKWGEEGDQ